MGTSLSEKLIVKAWYSNRWATLPLWPLSWAFKAAVKFRRNRFLINRRKLWHSATPIVIVGNLTVGGTGKTPLLIALTKAFEARGLRVGIISRGYGGDAPFYPFLVTANSNPAQAGDEPVILAKSTGCPVVVDPQRVHAAQTIAQRRVCDVILSDDGMQHYELDRDIEIAVVDGLRGFGNGMCLPAGPLREPPERLKDVNFVVINGAGNPLQEYYKKPVYHMQLLPQSWINLATGAASETINWRPAKRVHAVAGIGNPQRFFTTLKELGLEIIEHPFSDHHYFVAKDLDFKDDLPIVMTEKDAIKCRFVPQNTWYLRVSASLDDGLVDTLVDAIKLRAKEKQAIAQT